MSLTKSHIINAIVHQNGFTRKKSLETVEIILELSKSALESCTDALMRIRQILCKGKMVT